MLKPSREGFLGQGGRRRKITVLRQAQNRTQGF